MDVANVHSGESKENCVPRPTMTRRPCLTARRSHCADGKIGRSHAYENSSERKGVVGISSVSSVADSMAKTRRAAMVTGVPMGMDSMVSHLGTRTTAALYEASTRAMREVYLVETRISGVRRLAG